MDESQIRVVQKAIDAISVLAQIIWADEQRAAKQLDDLAPHVTVEEFEVLEAISDWLADQRQRIFEDAHGRIVRGVWL